MARQCTSCGASVEVPPEVLATTCRFCDASLVEVDSSMSRVDAVVPFVVTAARAGRELQAFLARQWLAPERLRKAAEQESIHGVLVPCFAYEATTRSSWRARIGIDWEREETYTETNSEGETEVKTRTVTETEWFRESGTHANMWVHHLVSASRGLPEKECNALEPFDLGRARPFAPELVAGNVAEHPTVPVAEAEACAVGELTGLAAAHVRAFMPGDRVRDLQVDTSVELQGVSLVLLPVWTAVVREGDTVLRLVVNGQTGEVVGEVPRSTPKLVMIVLAGLALMIAMVLAVQGGG